jgi:hypothetical protein
MKYKNSGIPRLGKIPGREIEKFYLEEANKKG